MRLSDRITGPFLAALGGITIYGASFLPPIPGQQIGPSIFPTVIGAGLILCGVLIALGIGRRFEDEAEADLAQHQDAAAAAATAPEPRAVAVLRTLVPLAALLFYVLAVDTLGFVPVAALMVAATAYALRASLWLSLAMAVAAPPLIHLVFYKLLRVPLPDGLLPMPW